MKNRILSGQSTAIVGEPRSGKTSLLLYLAATETRTTLYGERGEGLLFSYVDAQTLGVRFNQAKFWEYVLGPLHEWVIAPNPDSPQARAYEMCRENEFGTFVLERLLVQVRLEGWRLVLLLDEFDGLLHHQVLNSAEFFGSLRSLASRSKGALALVIASRQPLTDLNRDTQQFSRTSSPYFNFLSEVTLGPLPNKDIAALLDRGGDRFTRSDRHFIEEVAGAHPYLLQVAASAMWDAYDQGTHDADLRWQQVGQDLYDEVMLTIGNSWQLWPPGTRKTLTAVAFAQMPYLLGQRDFDLEQFILDIPDFGPELRSLNKKGFIAEDETIPGGWRVRPQAFLWWLADELIQIARDKTPFETWLRQQEWDGLLTKGKKEQLSKSVSAVAGLLGQGTGALIKTAVEGAAKGAAEGAAKGMVGGG